MWNFGDELDLVSYLYCALNITNIYSIIFSRYFMIFLLICIFKPHHSSFITVRIRKRLRRDFDDFRLGESSCETVNIPSENFERKGR